jgi:hypothetical protein
MRHQNRIELRGDGCALLFVTGSVASVIIAKQLISQSFGFWLTRLVLRCSKTPFTKSAEDPQREAEAIFRFVHEPLAVAMPR